MHVQRIYVELTRAVFAARLSAHHSSGQTHNLLSRYANEATFHLRRDCLCDLVKELVVEQQGCRYQALVRAYKERRNVCNCVHGDSNVREQSHHGWELRGATNPLPIGKMTEINLLVHFGFLMNYLALTRNSNASGQLCLASTREKDWQSGSC